MRMSRLFVQTLRESPADVALPGCQLLLRGGFIRSPSPGSVAFLPLGVEQRRRLEDRLRQVVCSLGGQEVALPTVQPADLTGGPQGTRAPDWSTALQHSVPLAGDRYRNWAVAGASDRYLFNVARHVIRSYRQLPVLLWQLLPALQEHVRPAYGLFGSRETLVIDACSLHESEADLHDLYYRLLDEFGCLIDLANLETFRVTMDPERDAGLPGCRLVWPTAAGEVAFVACASCGYAVEHAVARQGKQPALAEEMDQLQEVATPNCRTIGELCAFLGVTPARTAKTLFLSAEDENGGQRLVLAVVRGDMELSETKIRRLLGAPALRPADEAEIRAAGVEPGYGSPVGIEGAAVVVDDLIPQSPNLVAGANRTGYHLLNANYGRDFQAALVADIVLARDGDACPECGTPLALRRGVELALTGSVDENTTRALNLLYLDCSGEARPVSLGRYRFYLERLIAAASEAHHDGSGLVWPRALAPYDVHLMTVGKRSTTTDEVADGLYAGLAAAGARVLYDDRDERAGVKFNDADLIGLPLRVAVGERGLANGMVEVKHRRTGEVVAVPAADVQSYIGALL